MGCAHVFCSWVNFFGKPARRTLMCALQEKKFIQQKKRTKRFDMGLVSSRSADTTAAQLAALETQTQPVQPHPVLGFPVQIHADLVHDISRRDSQGNPKWKLLRPNSQTLVLNENYSFESEDEQLLLKLWFLYSTLQSRDKMRDFFYFSTAEQRQRQPQPEEQRRVLSTGFRSFRDVYDRWNRTLERT